VGGLSRLLPGRPDQRQSHAIAVREETDAVAIEELLRKMFPEWHYRRTFYDDQPMP
jgi:hypothetical protein